MTQDTSQSSIMGPHIYRNNQKMVPASEYAWDIAQQNNMLGIRVKFNGSQNNLLDLDSGQEIVNLCSCSYLGLNSHPQVIAGGVKALLENGVTGLSMAEFRIRLGIMEELETKLSEHFDTPVLPAVSCSAITAAILPMLGSGHLTNSEPLVVVFDKFAHFSMAFMKPIVADETLVLTCPHNDMNYLEDICKKYPRVAYVCDGVYSVGGAANVTALKYLQEKYGLFIYYDDSHALSAWGEKGEGYVRSQLPEMNEQTIIAASIAKAFGSTGGIAMLGSKKHYDFLYRTGPLGWSQSIRTAAIGTTLGSLEVHQTPELNQLQQQLKSNIDLFDQQINTPQKGNGLNIKVVEVGEQDKAVYLSKEMFKRGFYCSAVFFPIVPKGKAGIRIMLRGDLPTATTQRFIDNLTSVLAEIATNEFTTSI
ncbi:aminotransferase class I/II-fold pyridoxal phosphate-dependent enzyme [Cysteiniphilum litorale]|uniref:aminotransferase class I/II-fold pyridoxal phosphate-dependent enzyme n=1 Tax=Cysteiniphilum litorale TaxID=2056700 RepID=UPI003F88492E